MNLIYICPTCGHEYEAFITAKEVMYSLGNKRIALLDENQDCQSCLIKIKQAEDEARRKLKEERNHGQQQTI